MPINLISFGSPPLYSRNINPQLKALLPRSSVCFAFVIEGDPVPKLDMNYMMFLADSLRQTRSLLSKKAQEQHPLPRQLPRPLPPVTVHSVGDIIMFRELLNRSDEDDEEDEEDDNATVMLKVDEDVLGRAAWVNLCMHFMHQYLEIITAQPGLLVGL